MKQLVFLLLFLGTAAADNPKGAQTHELYNECKVFVRATDNNGGYYATAVEAHSGAHCVGYLRGFADGVAMASQLVTIDDNVTAEALVRSFVNYVNAHPGEMDSPAVTLVLWIAWRADNIIKPVKQ